MYVIEGWGTGIRRMIESCREYGVPEPVFTEIGTDFRVEFFRKVALQGQDVPLNVPLNVPINFPEVSEKSIDELIAIYAGKYPEIQMIIKNPDITASDMAANLECNRRTVSRHLKKLKELGILTHTGSKKVGRWEIISPK